MQEMGKKMPGAIKPEGKDKKCEAKKKPLGAILKYRIKLEDKRNHRGFQNMILPRCQKV